jgi:AcrR family transcriptional regulator
VPRPRRRQQDRSRATREALIEAAHRLFAERGYAAVSAEDIVSAAGVTRGALYHHFDNKRDLFRAMFEELEGGLTDEIAAAIQAAGDPASSVGVGIASFLDICERPEVVRLALTEAPAVLGWEEWRSIEARHGLGLIQATLERSAAAGVLTPAPPDMLAHLVLSVMIEAALYIAHAPDRRSARGAAQQGLLALMSGLRSDSAPHSQPTSASVARPSTTSADATLWPGV